MRPLLGGAFALLTSASPAGAEPLGELRAERLVEANLALRPGGTDALAGLGDLLLSNGVLCAALAAPEHETPLSASGGLLVDLGYCGRDDDQLVLLQPLVNLTQDGTVPVLEVRAERSDGEAAWVTVGSERGLRVETRYALDHGEPERLRVRTRLERIEPGERVFALAQVLLHGESSMRAFAITSDDLAASPGFTHPAFDLEDRLGLARAIGRSDVHVLVGAGAVEPPISYAHRLLGARLERRDGSRSELPRLALAADGFASVASLARPFWLGGGALGWLELPQLLFMDLAPGDALVQESELRVSRRRDTVAFTDRLFEDGVEVRGRVDDVEATVHVERIGGGALAMVRPDEAGRYTLRLPRGRHRMYALGHGGRETGADFVVGERGPLELPPLELGAPARVRMPRGRAMRIAFHDAEGPGRPVLHDDLLGFRLGDERPFSSAMGSDVSLAGRGSDPDSVALPPGRYRVVAGRGPEHGVAQAELRVASGEVATLELPTLERVLETPGWLAADLHVHTARSDDSSLPVVDRVVSFVAEGAEVLVATDHDQVSDLGPVVRALGLGEELATVAGVELSSSARTAAVPHTSAHANAFPIPHDPRAYRSGTPRHEGRRLRETLAGIRALGGDRLVQLNHPRGEAPGYAANELFTHLGVVGEPFDSTRPLEAAPNRVLVERDPESGLRDLDFDALELLNGPSLARYRAVRADWFALLRQGEVRVGTANSDTHEASEVAALPRTYVAQRDDRVTAFDAQRFVEALRAGRAFGTTGPLLEVSLGGVGLGGRVVAREASLRVEVRAADWVPVGVLRVFVDGQAVEERSLVGPGALELPLAFERDAFVTVEVEGPVQGPYADLYPGFTPFAFTNPIFVDADGDGRWTAPGLD